jgi:hypothetical protein
MTTEQQKYGRHRESPIYTAAAVASVSGLLWLKSIEQTGQLQLDFAIAAAGLYVIGNIVDSISTRRVIDAGPNVIELSPNLPERPTDNDLYGSHSVIGNSLRLVLGTVIAPIGIGLGVGHIISAFQNERLRQKIAQRNGGTI